MRSTLQSLKARRGQNEKGFTLIELLVVVVIIGILIAIAIPLYLNYQKSSHDKAADSDVRNAAIVMEQCYADNGVYPAAGTVANNVMPLTGCDGKINLSPGTVLTISLVAGPPASFKIAGKNNDGHANTNFCYDSSAGGSVKSQSTACS
jgi:type IV pilus assembly protein PilA